MTFFIDFSFWLESDTGCQMAGIRHPVFAKTGWAVGARWIQELCTATKLNWGCVCCQAAMHFACQPLRSTVSCSYDLDADEVRLLVLLAFGETHHTVNFGATVAKHEFLLNWPNRPSMAFKSQCE